MASAQTVQKVSAWVLACGVGVLAIVPFVAQAELGQTPATYGGTGSSASLVGLVNILMSLVYSVEWLLSGIAMVIFLFGIVRFVKGSADAKGHKEGYKMMLWGVIALFVIFSLNGIVWFMCSNLAGIGSFCRNQ